MTSDQVKSVEQAYRSSGPDEGGMVASKFAVISHELLAFYSFDSFVHFDEDNETIVCVRSNSDVYTQFKLPLTISTTGFTDVIMMEAFCNMVNFEAALDALCPNLDSDIKDKILKWGARVCGNVRNLAPIEDRPYYKNEPTPGGAFYPPKVRPDLAPGDSVYDQGYLDMP